MTIVILHSNGMCAEFYRPLCERLSAAGHDPVALTLPGFMGTPAVPGRLADLVDHLEPIVADALGPDGVLVGHSLGGMLAFLLAPRLQPRRLVLLEPAIVPIDRLTRLFARWYRAGTRRPGFRNRGPFFRRLHDPSSYPTEAWALVEENTRRTDPDVVPRLLASCDDALPLPFEQVTCPVTLVRGASSGPVMWAGQALLARRFPRATCVTLPRAGHWMVFEADDALADAVLLQP